MLFSSFETLCSTAKTEVDNIYYSTSSIRPTKANVTVAWTAHIATSKHRIKFSKNYNLCDVCFQFFTFLVVTATNRLRYKFDQVMID